jgi:hypothetical protein
MFLSISIDLVGSAALKTAIFQAGDNDYDVINAHYQTYVETMFEVEEALYRYVSDSGIVDIRDLFLAKIIGDEYWYLYEIDLDDHEHLNEVAHAFIFGLLEVMSKARQLRLPTGSGGEQCYDLSWKALVDLITNALHLPDKRYAYFEDKISGLLGRESRFRQAGAEDYSAICHALNVRPNRRAGETGIGIARSDYVGMQIDRFFRVAKTCKSRLVTVGEALWSRWDDIRPYRSEHRRKSYRSRGFWWETPQWPMQFFAGAHFGRGHVWHQPGLQRVASLHSGNTT